MELIILVLVLAIMGSYLPGIETALLVSVSVLFAIMALALYVQVRDEIWTRRFQRRVRA